MGLTAEPVYGYFACIVCSCGSQLRVSSLLQLWLLMVVSRQVGAEVKPQVLCNSFPDEPSP